MLKLKNNNTANTARATGCCRHLQTDLKRVYSWRCSCENTDFVERSVLTKTDHRFSSGSFFKQPAVTRQKCEQFVIALMILALIAPMMIILVIVWLNVLSVQTRWTNKNSPDRISAVGSNHPGARGGQLLLNLCKHVFYKVLILQSYLFTTNSRS